MHHWQYLTKKLGGDAVSDTTGIVRPTGATGQQCTRFAVLDSARIGSLNQMAVTTNSFPPKTDNSLNR